jgi:Gram-negative porin
MTRGTMSKRAAAVASLATALIGSPAVAEIPLVQYDGWRLSTDGRVNAFLSVAEGNGLPADQPENLGAGNHDSTDSNNNLHSSRIRNGFLMSILGFTGEKQITPDLKVTTRVALWMNVTGSRTKNIPGLIDPRELYAQLEGRWGRFLGGSDLSLFGRGATLMDAAIAHDYGLGSPCDVEFASGGGCGMVGFGEPFPGFEPGFVYATPSLGGLEISLGAYDPATISNAQLTRAPVPRFEGEARYAFKNLLRVFASGFWQVLEGTIPATTPAGTAYLKNLHTNAWGVQAGAMASLGPIMLGGAAYEGAGFSPITYIDESVIAADSAGVLRNSRGAFGLGAVTIDSLKVKIAGGLGVWRLDKNRDDSGPVSATGIPTNPALIKQNVGATVGIYQTTGPVHFALEYFRAQYTWYDRGLADPADPTKVDIVTPKQAVNFINAGMTVGW